jgi:hypothetical protein
MFSWIFLCCGFTAFSVSQTTLRFPNNSTVICRTWELPLSDTAKILLPVNRSFQLNSFSSMNAVRIDTIRYTAVTDEQYVSSYGRIDQTVRNSRNPALLELYSFADSAVYLAGYTSSENNNRSASFTPPIVVLPRRATFNDSTLSAMTTLHDGKKVNVRSSVTLKRSGKVTYNNGAEDFYQYDVTIAKDIIMPYGNQNLVMPGAMMMQSSMVYGTKSGLLAEWGIRSRPNRKTDRQKPQDQELYLELNHYQLITH